MGPLAGIAIARRLRPLRRDVDLFRQRAFRPRNRCSPISPRFRPTFAAMTATRSRPSPASAGSSCPMTNIPPMRRPRLHLGRGQDLLQAWRHRLSRPGRRGLRFHDQDGDRRRTRKGRLDDHAAGRKIPAPGQQLLDRPQGARSDPRFPAGIDAQQGADPRTLPQLHLPWPQCLWRAGGEPRLFRQGRQRSDAAGSGLSRGPSEGSVQLRSGPRDAEGAHRRNYVLREMYKNGYITEEQWRAAAATPLGTIRYGSNEKFRQQGGYFMEEVRRTLLKSYGDNAERRAEQRLCRRPLGPDFDGPGDAGRRGECAARRARAVRRRPRLARPRTQRRPRKATGPRSSIAHRSAPASRIGRRPSFFRRTAAATIGFTNGSTGSLPRVSGVMPKRGGGGTAFDNLRPGMIIIVKQLGASSYALRSIPEVRRRLPCRRSPHRPRPCDAGRLRRGRFQLQSGDAGASAAGLRLQADRLRDRARERLDAGFDHRRCAFLHVAGRRACRNKCFVNFDQRYAGPKTMRWGVEQSRNLMTVRAASRSECPRSPTRPASSASATSPIICRSRLAPARPPSCGW